MPLRTLDVELAIHLSLKVAMKTLMLINFYEANKRVQ